MGTWTPKRLPAKPLLDAVERRGGLAEVLTSVGIEIYDPTRLGESTLEYDREWIALKRGREDGYFTIRKVDEFCIKMLGAHPFDIYGDAWFFPQPLDTDAADAA